MSDYQAIYDAVRSRISGGNIGDAVREIAWQAFDVSHQKAILQEQIGIVGCEMTRPSVLFRPTLTVDGDSYCALYGEDLVQGCAGFGFTAAEAMADFDKHWWSQKAPTIGRGSAPVDRSGEADETRSGSAEGESAVPEGQAPQAPRSWPSS